MAPEARRPRRGVRGPGIEAKVAFLRRPEAYAEKPRSVEVVETHMSWVFLTERHAYKLKKPVRYDSLDFSTPELRRRDCEAEVRLNRRLTIAPHCQAASPFRQNTCCAHLGPPDASDLRWIGKRCHHALRRWMASTLR